jgi:hypothetical protein
MRHESGREALQYLAGQVARLSPQLYVQLFCQIDLMFHVVIRVITFFIQRQPNALRKFRWRIDQKSQKKENFEDAFEKLSPTILQTRSIDDPLPMVEGFDYRCLKEYMYEAGQAPTYLKDTYGIEAKDGLNIQKLIRGDIKFVNSQEHWGVQAADLIASGLRRCLRRGFRDNDEAAFLLGRLMVQAEYNKPPINLISYSDSSRLGPDVARLVRIMIKSCKPMVNRS